MTASDPGFVSSTEDWVNRIFSPIATAVSDAIFYEIHIGPLDIPLIVVWLIVAALFFTVYFRGIQVREFKHSISVAAGKYTSDDDPGEVNHFQAITSAVSGTVGLGNIAGVAVAVSIGGPGATFWMILAGFLGMTTKFVEATLAVKYREFQDDGTVVGGPFRYLPIAFAKLGKPVSKTLTAIFALGIIFFGLSGIAMFQTNQTLAQARNVFGSSLEGPGSSLLFGIVTAVVIGFIVMGGVRSIGKVASWLVPLMAAVYVLGGLVVILANINNVPDAISQIVQGAFSPSGVGGGFFGVMIIGFQRAAFSNEAGVGSSPTIHAAVKTRHPVTEGMVALLEPFIDTVVICTMTALIIIIGAPDSWLAARDEAAQTGDISADGVVLTSDAFATVIPWFPYVLALAVALFAVSSILAWAYYAKTAWITLVGYSQWKVRAFLIFYLAFVVIGAVLTMSEVLALGDAMLFMCALVNIFGLYFLFPVVRDELRDYRQWRKRQSTPTEG